MQPIGYIDLKKYQCISEVITTEEVVITSERIQHIEKRHPGSYERIKNFFEIALSDPDYILKDHKNPNTGIILKLIEDNELRLQMVLRVHTATDDTGFKNSIISAWNISESRWKNYIRNKKILYKKN